MTFHYSFLDWSNIDLGQAVCNWFENYLIDRTQWVSSDGAKSGFFDIMKGVPQGSILGLVLFTVCINNVCLSAIDFLIHTILLYADDTVVYAISPMADQVLSEL